MFKSKHMSIGDWFLWHILMLVPLVNIIVFIIVLLSPETTPSLKSYMKFQIIVVILSIAGLIAFAGCMAAFIEGLEGIA